MQIERRPVCERAVAGPLDALDAFRRLRGAGPALLLEFPRASTVLFAPAEVLRIDAGSADRAGPDAFARLERFLARHGCDAPVTAGDAGADAAPPPFRGGVAGLLGYDLGRHLERLPATARRDTNVPDLWLGAFDRGLELDGAGRGVLFARQERDLDAAQDALTRALPQLDLARAVASAPVRSNFAPAAYCAAVERVREWIRAGDVYQVNLAQRFETRFDGDPFALYARLRHVNPAPYAALVDGGDFQLLSSSPESFLERRADAVVTRPIKGTRRRTGAAAADDALAAELSRAPKDAAELAMIVDLERNDLGRVARFGSVEVADPGRVEAFASVLHRVATVRARLAPGRGTLDLLRATFPGGSVTGAPKIRAMEIIEELEGIRRGAFTGAIGWIAPHALDLNLAIRTLVLEGGRAHFHAGGGIVLDSDPRAEYLETIAKGDAIARALGHPLPAHVSGRDDAA